MCLAAVTGITTRATSYRNNFLLFFVLLSPKVRLKQPQTGALNMGESARAHKIHVLSRRAGTVRARAAVLVDFCNHLGKRTGKHTLPATTHGRQTVQLCTNLWQQLHPPTPFEAAAFHNSWWKLWHCAPNPLCDDCNKGREKCNCWQRTRGLLNLSERCWSKLFLSCLSSLHLHPCSPVHSLLLAHKQEKEKCCSGNTSLKTDARNANVTSIHLNGRMIRVFV